MTIFPIDPVKHTARWNYLQKAVMEQIKERYRVPLWTTRSLPVEIRGGMKFPKLENIKTEIDVFIGVAVVRLLCYENAEKDREMCKEMEKLGYCPKKYYEQYALETYAREVMLKEMQDFVNVYKDPIKDNIFSDSNFNESYTALQHTFKKAQNTINELIKTKYSFFRENKNFKDIKLE